MMNFEKPVEIAIPAIIVFVIVFFLMWVYLPKWFPKVFKHEITDDQGVKKQVVQKIYTGLASFGIALVAGSLVGGGVYMVVGTKPKMNFVDGQMYRFDYDNDSVNSFSDDEY